MKNFKIFSLSFAFLVFIIVSCNKESKSIEEGIQMTQTENSCFFVEQYEQYGDFAYDYAENRLLNDDPTSIFPAELQEFYNTFLLENSSLLELSLVEKVDYFIGEEVITQEMGNTFLELESIYEKAYADGINFEGLIVNIKQKRMDYALSNELSCSEKKDVVMLYSIAEKLTLWHSELFSEQGLSFRSEECCSSWDQFICFGQNIVGWTIIGYGVGILSDNPHAQSHVDLDERGLGTTLGALGGALIGLGVAINTCCEDCDCRPVSFVSLSFNDCTPSAKYRAGGFGPDDILLEWSNANGTPPTANTSVHFPLLTIAQPVATNAVETIITSICIDGGSNTSRQFTRNIFDLALGLPNLGIAGNSEPNLNLGISFTYSGIGMSDPRFAGNWEVVNGTIIGSDDTFVEVQWNAEEDSGQIILNAKNTCPGGASEQYVFDVDLQNNGPQ